MVFDTGTEACLRVVVQQNVFIRVGLGSEALEHFAAHHNANLS